MSLETAAGGGGGVLVRSWFNICVVELTVNDRKRHLDHALPPPLHRGLPKRHQPQRRRFPSLLQPVLPPLA